MQCLKRALSAGLALVTLLAATISNTGTASAAGPSGLDCDVNRPGIQSEVFVFVGQTITCTFNTGGNTQLGRQFDTTYYNVSDIFVDSIVGISGEIQITPRRFDIPFDGRRQVCIVDLINGQPGNFRTCATINV